MKKSILEDIYDYKHDNLILILVNGLILKITNDEDDNMIIEYLNNKYISKDKEKIIKYVFYLKARMQKNYELLDALDDYYNTDIIKIKEETKDIQEKLKLGV